MKYNIFTISNEAYFPFLDIFINSVNANCKSCEKIIVINTGIPENLVSYIKNKPKVEVLDYFVPEKYTGVHSAGWIKTTFQKTKSLLNLFSDDLYSTPTILVDSDVYVHKELEPLINLNHDIQVTVMDKKNQHMRDDGIFLKHIGCFAIFNDIKKSKIFVENWITKMEEFSKLYNPPFETPSLNLIIKENKNNLSIGDLDEKVVCPDQCFFPDSYSIHFKSNGSTTMSKVDNFLYRLKFVKNYSSESINLSQYLDKEMFSRWVNS